MSLCLLWVGCQSGDRPVARIAPNPILLLHGLGGKADSWNDAGLRGYFEGQGLRYGGVIRLDEKGRAVILEGPENAEQGDFFHVQISDPLAELALWSQELVSLLSAARRSHGAPVVLVGFSAGGLAGRKYLVDHPTEHGVAKLLTIAAPHRGSELALVAEKLRAVTAGSTEGGFLHAVLKGGLSRFEKSAGIPLAAPLIQELLPEGRNPSLAELNRSSHPSDLEYACLVAVGSAGFEGWRDFEQDLVLLRNGQLKDSVLLQKLVTRGMGLLASRGGWLLGDGAVLADSQDLRNVEFFRRSEKLVSGCPSVQASHQGAKERYQAVFESIASPARFLAARAADGSRETRASLEVDFHHYLAGLTRATARNPASGRSLLVSRPALYQSRETSFARVTVGPFDPSRITTVEVLVDGPEPGYVKGKRILLGGEEEPWKLPAPEKPKPITLTLHAVEGIPRRHPADRPWDLDGSPADLQLILLVGETERFRTTTYQDVYGGVRIDESIQIEVDPRQVRIRLVLEDVDPLVSERMGEIVWNPGHLPRGPALVPAGNGISVRLEVADPNDEGIDWEPGPFRVELR